jgi:hypothetical protein
LRNKGNLCCCRTGIAILRHSDGLERIDGQIEVLKNTQQTEKNSTPRATACFDVSAAAGESPTPTKKHEKNEICRCIEKHLNGNLNEPASG